MKRPKPNKNRPFLIASESREIIILRILYPDGTGEILLKFGDSDEFDWFRSTFTYNKIKALDKHYGWKTHFLGNL